jgi:hypothetical protein
MEIVKKYLKVIGNAAEIRIGHEIDAASEEGAGENSCSLEA